MFLQEMSMVTFSHSKVKKKKKKKIAGAVLAELYKSGVRAESLVIERELCEYLQMFG